MGTLHQFTKGRSFFDLPFEKCSNYLPTKTPWFVTGGFSRSFLFLFLIRLDRQQYVV